MRHVLGLIAVLGGVMLAQPATAQLPRYKVIVNADNPAAVLMASELSRIYLGTANAWPDRTLVFPVDQPEGSPLQQRFLREIIRKDSAALSRYWEQAIFSGRAVPPRTMADDLEILDFVRKTRGAIAYVDASTVLGREVKVLQIVR